MGDTIAQSMKSFLATIDDQFEVIIVDDGSSDNSGEEIRKLALADPRIKPVFLKRSIFRLLGETRNESIRHASGQYVILHIDTDDIWQPYVKDFLKIYHAIEMVRGGEFYLQGQQIGIAPRSLLLEHGPYRNTFCEDRDMWRRFAGLGIYMGLKHKVFRDRMKLTRKKRVFKAVFIKTFHHLLYDFNKTGFHCATASPLDEYPANGQNPKIQASRPVAGSCWPGIPHQLVTPNRNIPKQ